MTAADHQAQLRPPSAAAIARLTFEQIFLKLQAAVAWLQALNVRIEGTRFAHYVRSLEALVQAHRTSDYEPMGGRLTEIMNALYEAQELAMIHDAFGASHGDYVAKRLLSLSSGPSHQLDESGSSNAPRNLAFELLIAARLQLGGLTLLGHLPTDVAAQMSKHSILIECKRPQSMEAVQRNIKRAAEQLRDKYKSADRLGYRGVIALDLTKALQPEFAGAMFDEESDVAPILRSRVDALLDELLPLMLSKAKSQKTIAYAVRLSAMLMPRSPSGSMIYAQQYGMRVLDCPERSRQLARELGAVFRRSLEDPAEGG